MNLIDDLELNIDNYEIISNFNDNLRLKDFNFEKIFEKNYINGILWGCVFGDSLGLDLEFEERVFDIPIVTKYRGSMKGWWTDDSSMLFATIIALKAMEQSYFNFYKQEWISIESNKFILYKTIMNFYSLFTEKALFTPKDYVYDCGLTLATSLQDYKEVQKIENGLENHFKDTKDKYELYSAGNGTIMKQGAITTYLYEKYQRDFDSIVKEISDEDKSRISTFIKALFDSKYFINILDTMNEISHVISSSTHKNLTASYSCYIMNIILTTNLILNNNLIGDLNKVKNMKQAIFLETMIYIKKYIEEKINEDIDLGRLDKDKPVISEINRIINLNSKTNINEMGEEKYLCPDWVLFDYKEIYNTGYSVESLISALHSYYHSNNALEAIVRAANLYGDADTIAAITGQIAGSFYGIKEFYENDNDLINDLFQKNYIQNILDFEL